MAVFRVERNRGYTVMSNHHLRKDCVHVLVLNLVVHRYKPYLSCKI